MAADKKAVQFGAGNIGRGFLGQLFAQSGYEIIFVDKDERVIAALNESNSYSITVVGENQRLIPVGGVVGLHIDNQEAVIEELATAQIAATAVGVNAIGSIAPVLAQGIERRWERGISQPLNIIICENLLHAGKVLKEKIREYIEPPVFDYLEQMVGFVESVVSRMVPIVPPEIKRHNPLYVAVEEYAVLPVDKKGFVGRIPYVEGMIPYENLLMYEERKLFVHNGGHTIAAYLGYLKGYTYIYQCVEDAELLIRVRKALDETSRALIRKHGFQPEEQKAHVNDLIQRFANRYLRDTVARAGRDPIRKLSPNDRLIGAARLCQGEYIEPRFVALGIAAALCYDNPEDNEALVLSRKMREEGLDRVLGDVCGLNAEENLTALVKEQYRLLKDGD